MAGNKILVRIHLFRESFIRMSLASLDLDPGGDGGHYLFVQSLPATMQKTSKFWGSREALSWTQRNRQTCEAKLLTPLLPLLQAHRPLLLFPEYAKQGAAWGTSPSFLSPGAASPRWRLCQRSMQRWCPSETLCKGLPVQAGTPSSLPTSLLYFIQTTSSRGWYSLDFIDLFLIVWLPPPLDVPQEQEIS